MKIRGLRIELGEIDAGLQRHDDVAFAVTVGATTPVGAAALVSYLLPKPGATIDPADVKMFVAEFLPEYMLPAAIMVLDEVPRTPIGKLDRKALPTPDFGARAGTSRSAATETERLLAGLFAEVLGVEAVGAEESFFALGGDSIMSIQLVSRAKAAGLSFSARDVFERKTVAAIATVATRSDAVATLAELPGGGIGTFEPTPIVAAMLAQDGPFDRFGQAMLIRLPHGIDRATLTGALQAVIDRHDVLRSALRVTQSSGAEFGDWAIEIGEVGSVDAAALLTLVRADADNDVRVVADVALQAAADRLDPTAGIVLQAVWIDTATEGYLWLVVHHLAVDGVSWRIILPDLATAATQLAAGETVALASSGTSLRTWAHEQRRAATDRRAELGQWQATLDGPDPTLGDRVLDVAEDLAETMGRIDIRVPAETTGAVLTTVAQRFHGGANDALLTALAMAVLQWRRQRDTACTSTLITLERHGREEHIAPGAELDRTVGWFTSIYPVRLDLAGIDLDDAFAGGAHAGAAIKRVKQQLREIPDNGIGFGMLRYLDAESTAQLAAAPSPQISFNYLGRTELGARGPWLPATDIAGPAATADPTMPLPAVLDINAIGEDTATGTELAVTWAYASKLLSESDVRELADLWTRALEALAAHAAAPAAGGHTPSDFPLVAVSQTEIEGWEQQHPALTDVWPLSPLQFGLLFHALYDTDTADGYTVQATLTLAGSVDGDRLHRAAQALVDRHANLRAAFVETVAGPRQIVLGEAEVGWQEMDLRASIDIDHAVETAIAEDGANRFDLTRAPLLRFTLLRTGTDSYRLLMTNHHILLDGWSTPLLVQELLVHYAGGGAALTPPPAYRDYLGWLDRQDDATSIAAWTRALAGVDAPTRAVPSLAGITSTETGEVSIDLGVDATTALHELGRAHGVTVNTAVQAAWAMLLHTMTGRADVVFGGTVSGRPADIDGVEQMIGLFINTLPVRVQLDPAESVADLLRRVQLEQAALLDHQHVGLTDIHAAVGLPELFDTLTVFESYPIDRDALARVLDIAGMRVTDIAGTDATPYPLSLLAIPNRVRDAAGEPAESLTMTLKYLAGELDHAAATQVLDRLIALLRRFTADPAARICALATDVVAVRSGAESVSATTLPEILGAAATRNPDAIALSSGGVSLTYRELDSWSNRLARVLLRHGAGPDRFVILALPRSVESVVAVWAIAKTGAAFLPLDPNHPPERIEHMVTDSRARIGVTTTAQGANLPGTIDWLLLDDLATVRKTMTVPDAPITAADRGVPVHIDQTAYLIYTSGSTGKPKAVLLSHRGLANLVRAQHESLGLDPESTVLQVASPSFDASVFELLMAHGAGGRLVVAPSDVYGGDGLAELIRAQGISHAVITPSALATMEPRDVDGLRVLAVAGEAAGTDLVARWAPGRTMLNLYGPTEFSVWATGGTAMTSEAPITIGSPIRGAAVLVLDDWLRPVPAGTAGELYLTGPALARGYFDRFGLTAGRFVANPHGAPGERMYRTGDIVSVNGGEELEYLGRSDFQVKIRGLRIELGEIDAVLVADDAVDYVATIGQPGPSGSTVLVSYVLPMAGAALDTERLRERVAAVLPGYMVPAVVVALAEIPLTPVGKLDRKALPMPDLRTRPSSTYLAPRTPAEQTLTRVFGELLGVEQVGVDESFFDLGGNSLLATRAVARINASIDGTVALRDLFDAPTAAQLATRIDGADDGPVRPLLRPYDRPQHVPLSPAQQRMWFLNRFDRDSAAYNMPMAIRLTGELDIAALHAAVADVIDRHEVLRTVYPETADGAVQVILPATRAIPQLVVERVSESVVAQRILQLAAEPFDVTTAVPLRGALLELAPDEHVLVMVLHHIAGDGWSFAPLARDVMLAYTARLCGEAPQWQPLDVQYADFALWQRDLLGDEADSESLAAQQVGYWADALAGLPDQLVLPADRPRPALQTYRGGRVAFELDPATHAALDELARAHDASLFMVLHSAFAVLLARLSGSTDIAIGSPVAGRGDRMLDELIGMFVNTMVFRSAVDPSAAFTDLLADTRERDLRALAHADVPFERLVEVLDPVRTTAWHPLFQVGFSFENLSPTEFELPGLRVSQVDVDAGISQFDLHLVVVDGRDAAGAATGIEGHFTYAADIFDPDTVQGIGERFARVLHGIVADPARPVGDLALLGPAEHNRILNDWNATAAAVPSGTLADLVDAQVARTPAGTALTFSGEHLTYAELDARVNRFARYLVGLGVGPESVVALGLGRCVEQVVAMLAVCKAGGAYLPIDLDHPIERSAYVLEMAQPVCVLTTLTERDRLPAGHRTVEIDALDTADYAATPLTDADRRAALNPGNTAYVIFTSGSTGRPKGVAITHDAIVNQLAWKVAAYEMGADDTVLAKTPMTFDVSVWEYWSGLVSGGRTVLARSGGDRDAAYLNALVADEAVTQLHLVPATLQAMLVDADGALSASLRHVLVIGETLPAAAAARFRRHNDARLHNTYGPTEAAVSITAYESTDADETSVPIGTPEWNSKVYVLDARLQPVPTGVLGELYLAGNQLARGYFDRPGITADRFVANPFDPAGGRMYRTGDLVAWGATGDLDYIGRTDFQVKVRGFRIELGEVETALLAQDDVAAGAVITREDERLGAQLVAYVVAERDAGVNTDDLSRRLGAALPSYMVPTAFVVLDELPLNVNGKLDRTALPAPEFTAAEFREPATAVERAVAAVFADILGVDRVGLDDDFFALGGNSLIATQAVSRLRAELGVEVAVMALFAQSTVAGLAERIGAAGAAMRSADEILGVVLPIRPEGELAPLFCVHPASGLAWGYAGLAQSIDPRRPIYGLQSPELTGAGAPASIVEFAQLYVEQIRVIEPYGPYQLLGWSFGGFVAHEIAVQLRALGAEVELLAMMDPDLASRELDPGTPLTPVEFVREFGPVLGIDAVGAADAAGAARAVTESLGGAVHFEAEHIERLTSSYNAALRMIAGFEPGWFDGDLVFFSATQGSAEPGGGADSWRPYIAGTVSKYPIDATHDGMAGPEPLRAIAQRVQQHLDMPAPGFAPVARAS
ncbi:amino acid adenylation domain-containing protein [Aldersonia sp. NBC_00410]|uniref:amino acid adenylation domain-containing protein n=1 Tax=Aldersonia sp. NBC_00410 TaxID=2975954 RepID=UPI002251B68D|nr:non-ribosomal peptide synthetase [Aldersonia sp. NBC_00410]MCX5046521.1 amino acid adenylation domain-containing protein [Aldersonia sp. NBC_00410]